MGLECEYLEEELAELVAVGVVGEGVFLFVGGGRFEVGFKCNIQNVKFFHIENKGNYKHI